MPYLDLLSKGKLLEVDTAQGTNGVPVHSPGGDTGQAQPAPVYVHLGKMPASVLSPLQMRLLVV